MIVRIFLLISVLFALSDCKKSQNALIDNVEVDEEGLSDALGVFGADYTKANIVGNYKKYKKPKTIKLSYGQVKKFTSNPLGYLRDYGYLEVAMELDEETAEATGAIVDETVIKNTIKEFQKFNKLPVTGDLDQATFALMTKARCGDKDVVYSKDTFDEGETTTRRVKRYVLSRRKWGRPRLYYHIKNYTPDMKRSLVRSEIEKGLRHWADISDISFVETDEESAADIKMSFEIGDHGDRYPFYGAGGALAHAYYPTKGLLHFDDAERFTSGVNSGINLYYTATHEIGHLLGIKHSNAPGAIMNAYYPGYSDSLKLSDDDINAAAAAIGTGSGTVTPLGDGYIKPKEDEGPTDFDGSVPSCFEKIDAALKFADKIYLFSGKWFYRMVQDSRRMPKIDSSVTNPRLIKDHFSGLPNNLDGAVRGVVSEKGKAYFFKGNQYYLYDFSASVSKVVEGPLPIASISSVLNAETIDGAFQASSSSVAYLNMNKMYKNVNNRAYSAAQDTLFNKLVGTPDAATRGYIGGWVWIFHGATFSVNRLKNGQPGRGYESRPIMSDMGITMCAPGELIGELNVADTKKCTKEFRIMSRSKPKKGFIPSEMCLDYLQSRLKPQKYPLREGG